uniref:PCI domain-containing protein n=1 Tax=Chromera velia CCMP2878 TaxID=1169474 RepID=A0A0G4HZT1_9ALVE|eukprot:Cvel_9798.t1-p1 / transcript=Cvel_9798.t1 / gene=Cvel_9798 / organism=Chromera_velia_CCMP2878 / gene_product=Eukaryotic translation initiation factor 3 subunit, putative / transcript_product=Eukaryotic translation initiation factor 3 subunit, putative / location=Cvel_scaffold575:14721-19504(+) / protein_length=558 / sequence_SO=supercontig / SO=protein_coding / is_pseudo=false
MAPIKSRYDISKKLLPYLDPHMGIRVLDFLTEKKVYNEADLQKARIQLLSKTCNFERLEEEVEKAKMPDLLPKDIEELKEKAQQVQEDGMTFGMAFLRMLHQYEQQDAARIKQARERASDGQTSGFGDTQPRRVTVQELRDYWVGTEHEEEIPDDVVQVMWQFAKTAYETGADYNIATKVLNFFADVVVPYMADPWPASKKLDIAWGILAAMIMHGEFDMSEEAIGRIEGAIEQSTLKLGDLEMRVQRVWLLHWAFFPLFLFFFGRRGAGEGEQGRNPQAATKFLEWLLADKNLSIVQMTAPHLLRYYSAIAVIACKRLKAEQFESLLSAIAATSHRVSDPFAELLDALFVSMDLEKSQEKLAQCSEACQVDFFLVDAKEDFEEAARLLIFERYCRIHSSVDIDLIARKLNMEPEEAEVWIVNLIRSAQLDAKIDAERNRVVMSTVVPNVYQQVLDKTRGSIVRTNFLAQQCEKREKAAREREEGGEGGQERGERDGGGRERGDRERGPRWGMGGDRRRRDDRERGDRRDRGDRGGDRGDRGGRGDRDDRRPWGEDRQ